MLSFVLTLALGLPIPVLPQHADQLRGAPLHYDAAATKGLVEKVARRLESGELELGYEAETGYLPALLEALGIGTSSQVLVFSKTSFQSKWISPATPRSVYFGDEAYVGAVPGGPIIEITSMDPGSGPVFYSLDQDRERPPRLTRKSEECLRCHATSRTQGWPGHLLRSVHPDAFGQPVLRSGTTLVSHETPFEKRWGGWYVTGTHGAARHLGNAFAEPETGRVDPESGANITDLEGFIDTERYLSPHSDLVALMVLEHQAEMHNRIARSGYEVRLAFHRQEEMNKVFGDPTGTRRAATQRILKNQTSKLLRYMLFENESRLPAAIRGTSAFAAEFQQRGRRDPEGRSLRDLDLKQRLFRYPCSYLIHSQAFEALPEPLLEVFHGELWKALNDESSFVSAIDRAAIRAILVSTKNPLPEDWR